MHQTPAEIHLRFDAATIAPAALVSRLAPFCQSHPSICVVLRGADQPTIEAELIAGHIHAAFLHAIDEGRDYITTQQVGTVRHVAVAAPAYLTGQASSSSSSSPYTAADVLKLSLIDTAHAAPGQRLWLGAAADQLAPAPPRLIVPDVDTALAAARAGAGVAFVPDRTAAALLAGGELHQLAAPAQTSPAAGLPLLVAYRRKNSRPLAESVLLEFLLDTASPSAEP